MKKVFLFVLLLGLGAAAGVLGYKQWLAQKASAAVGALRLYGNIERRDAQLAFFGNNFVVFLKRLQVDVSIETTRLEFFDVITVHANDMNNSRSRRQIGSVVGNN